ncbi:MAG TPA: DnaB-like helicase C-terminal domain-containing protein, partial [Candidatus Absconditabacterales bacterium]|nr:DnaB-like helicase C-terminal domain-containing protein [Candidatus Absconditabacterales bacterium]
LPGTINPRLKIKKDEVLRDLGDYTCDIMMFDPKISKLYEGIEQYAEQYEKEKEKEKEDAKIIHQIVKSERKKPNDIWAEINSIPSCDVACDIRPITISDKGSDNVALKESHKNMGAYWYRPNNIIVNTGSSLIKTNKNHFTTYELIFYEYANQDKQKTLEYFKTKYNIEVKSEKKSFNIQPIKYEKKGYLYPSEIFDPFECVMSGELVTIVAPSHSGKTTFAMDMIQRNSGIGKKCFYINLEFAIETVRQNRRLYANGKTKKNITDLDPLTEQERSKMNDYVQKNLKKFEYFNDPKGITLQELVELIQSKHNQGYGFFVLDTFSKIDGNLDSKVSHTSQNNSM